jgi:hypothetical protein
VSEQPQNRRSRWTTLLWVSPPLLSMQQITPATDEA